MKKLLFTLVLLPALLCAQAPKVKTYCGAATSKGSLCQMTVKKPGDKCRWHNADSPRCTGIKKDGSRCRMVIKPQQLFCHLHKTNK